LDAKADAGGKRSSALFQFMGVLRFSPKLGGFIASRPHLKKRLLKMCLYAKIFSLVKKVKRYKQSLALLVVAFVTGKFLAFVCEL
jgi:hypothetical protein